MCGARGCACSGTMECRGTFHLVLLSHCIDANCRRVRGDPYYELMDEFLTAVKRRYGNTVLLQFEGMAYENASRLLNMYRWGQDKCGDWKGLPLFLGDSGQATAGVTSDRQAVGQRITFASLICRLPRP